MADELKNVRISVLKHFEDNLAGTSAIDIAGADFDTKTITEWFEPRVLGPVSTASRRTERQEAWFLNVNCYAKTGEDIAGAQEETIHRPWELADAVRGVFHQADIDLQNWAAGGDPSIGTMRFEEADMTPVLGGTEKTSLQQVNVSIPFAIIQKP